MTKCKGVFKKRKNVGKPKQTNTTPSTSKESSNITIPRSGSVKKLDEDFQRYEAYESHLEYDIINLNELEKALQKLFSCRLCQGAIKISKKQLSGLAVKINFACSVCGNNEDMVNCSKIKDEHSTSRNEFYDLNVRLVYGMRAIGKGKSAAEMLCGVMNIPQPPHYYHVHENFLCRGSEIVSKNSMNAAVEEAVLDNDGSRDLAIALDGSWQKRGHTSLNGIMSATAVCSGKVIDIEIFSKFCKCPDKTLHLDQCQSNYQGTSGGMEVTGALNIYKRSVETYNCRYLWYLGDGDSRAYKAVIESQPYGEHVEIKKAECIGHVQKRFGTKLLSLKQKRITLSDGKGLFSAKYITENSVRKLKAYYGLAIRRNTTSIDSMKKAIWAEYFHVSSSNESPKHAACPSDDLTWCKYRKAEKLDEVYDHRKHFHLPEEAMLHLKPIFREMADNRLLEKCLLGKTQNPNESLNNTIWAIVPKRIFVALKTLRFGVFEAVSSFNDGQISKCKLFEHLKLIPGKNFVYTMKMFDKRRIRKSEKQFTELEKKLRQKRALKRRKLEDTYEAEEEDNPSYSTGMY